MIDRAFPRCATCRALLLDAPRPGFSVSFSKELRAALAAEMEGAAALFLRVLVLAAPFHVSPRWETRARSRAFVLRAEGRLDRERYMHAGKASPDCDALRFACWCGERERAAFVRAQAFARAAASEAQKEVYRDLRDVPKLVARLHIVGAEQEAAEVERAALPWWAESAVSLESCDARDRFSRRCVRPAADGHEEHRSRLGNRWTGRGASAVSLPRAGVRTAA